MILPVIVLHIGSMIQLMLLHWLDFYDHKPIALLGGGTTLSLATLLEKMKLEKFLCHKDIEDNISNIKGIHLENL